MAEVECAEGRGADNHGGVFRNHLGPAMNPVVGCVGLNRRCSRINQLSVRVQSTGKCSISRASALPRRPTRRLRPHVSRWLLLLQLQPSSPAPKACGP